MHESTFSEVMAGVHGKLLTKHRNRFVKQGGVLFHACYAFLLPSAGLKCYETSLKDNNNIIDSATLVLSIKLYEQFETAHVLLAFTMYNRSCWVCSVPSEPKA